MSYPRMDSQHAGRLTSRVSKSTFAPDNVDKLSRVSLACDQEASLAFAQHPPSGFCHRFRPLFPLRTLIPHLVNG